MPAINFTYRRRVVRLLCRCCVPVVGLLFAATALHACNCVRLSTGCDRGWTEGGTIFLGKVLSIDGRFVSFEVMESFRGAPKPGEHTTITTATDEAVCGYPFATGGKYLVYAVSSGANLETGTCSETAPAVMSSSVLEELRNFSAHRPVSEIFGTVGTGPRGNGWKDLVEITPLAHVPIYAVASKGTRYRTETDDGGAYSFARLPAGIYHVEKKLPAGLSDRPADLTAAAAVSVSRNNSEGAGRRVDDFPRPDGLISGEVVDRATGRGLAGFVTLEPVDPEEAEAATHHGGFPGDETVNGGFILPQLPPGQYRLVFEPSTSPLGRPPSNRFYWPPKSGNADDPAIDVPFGKHVENIRFEVTLPK